MTSSDDFLSDMDRFPFDDSDAEAVFGASPGSDSVPEGLRDVADLVHTARRAGSADELVDEDVVVAQIAAAIGGLAASPQGDAHERIHVLRKFRTAKLTAAATAVLMLGGTAAAAATGSLPAPVQSSVATGLSGVGIRVPRHHHVRLAVQHVKPVNAAQPHHWDAAHSPGASGVVASVNSISDPGTCGVADTAGVFTLTSHKGTIFTVNVDATTTTFLDKGVTGPSFLNVCVGERVKARGALTDTTVAATEVKIKPPRPPRPPHVADGALGTVASVNGIADPGTCGVSGVAGVFTLTGHEGKTFTVNVDTTTPFLDAAIPSPTFVNLCVGEFVLAKGVVTDTTVAATQVFIAPAHKDEQSGEHKDMKHHHGALGTVASVNGVSDPGTCGMSGAAVPFTITGHNRTTFTVNVDTSTKFFAPGVTGPSFVNVCVGAEVVVKGDITGTTVTATAVIVLPKHDGKDDGKDEGKDDGDHGSNHSNPGPAGFAKHAGFAHHGSKHHGDN